VDSQQSHPTKNNTLVASLRAALFSLFFVYCKRPVTRGRIEVRRLRERRGCVNVTVMRSLACPVGVGVLRSVRERKNIVYTADLTSPYLIKVVNK
jgi:hypothetical protein